MSKDEENYQDCASHATDEQAPTEKGGLHTSFRVQHQTPEEPSTFTDRPSLKVADVFKGVKIENEKFNTEIFEPPKVLTRERRAALERSDPFEHLQVRKLVTSDTMHLNIACQRPAKSGTKVLEAKRIQSRIKHHLEKWDLTFFFENIILPKKDERGNIIFSRGTKDGKSRMNLFEEYFQLDLQEVYDSVLYTYGYGYDQEKGANLWMPSDLGWSGEFLLNQCSDEMKNGVLRDLEMAKIPEAHRRVGPLVFKALMDRLTGSNYKAMTYLLATLKKLDLYSDEFQGDIGKFITTTLFTVQVFRQRGDLGQSRRHQYHLQHVSEDLLRIFSNTGNQFFDSLHEKKLAAGLRRNDHDAAFAEPEDILYNAFYIFDVLDRNDAWDQGGVSKQKAALGFEAKGRKCFGCGQEDCRATLETCPRYGKVPNTAGKKAKEAAYNQAKKKKKKKREG